MSRSSRASSVRQSGARRSIIGADDSEDDAPPDLIGVSAKMEERGRWRAIAKAGRA